VIDRHSAIHDNVIDPDWFGEGVIIISFISDGLQIKDDDVCPRSRLQDSAVL